MFLESTHLSRYSKSNSKHFYQNGNILPVLSARELLEGKHHQALLAELAELSGLPNAHFSRFYEDLIFRLAEFVQLLPYEEQGALGGLLNRSIARAMIALRQHLTEPVMKRGEDPLLNFAIFSAALLIDVGKVVGHFKILLANQEGTCEGIWQPFSGSLIGKAEYYKAYPRAAMYQRLSPAITPLLAKELLNEDAFSWLFSDSSLFANWLEILRGEGGSEVGRLTLALTLTVEALEELLNTLLAEVHTTALECVAMKQAEAFYRWLRDRIDKGDVKVNTADAMIHVLGDQVFIDNNMYQYYIEQSKLSIGINVVQVQFGSAFGIREDFLERVGFAGKMMRRSFLSSNQNREHQHGGKMAADLLFKNQIPQNSPVATKTIVRSLPELTSSAPPSKINLSLSAF